MQRSFTAAARSLIGTRGFCTSNSDKIVASVLFERLPDVVPKIDPVVYAFQEFSEVSFSCFSFGYWKNVSIFEWVKFRRRRQYHRAYPDKFLKKSDARGKGDYQIDYVPAPRVTEADKTNDKRSLQRALDRRLYLLLYGKTVSAPHGRSVWHFPENVYKSEETLRKCAESALLSVIGDLSDTYFVGNAPMGHMVEVMECSGRMFKCAVCQVDLALSEGISVHAGEGISVHAGSIFSMSSKPWQGPVLCTDCMPWKENEWS
ncbi:hypothetical protein RHSIM_Rhsim09G0104800 [Rhododendron simsii]|uniref:Uncharacterized protein n=1 Tax=Rhododendron simsii TaxID=118357 RepID=A0A834LF44_RHOSS|nr:hypothetical protein RHSIM_Rhsim09G0104800 [Rhododendron simsii]